MPRKNLPHPKFAQRKDALLHPFLMLLTCKEGKTLDRLGFDLP